MKRADPFHLWTVRRAVEVSAPRGKCGVLCLSKIGEAFCIHWAPLEDSGSQDVAAIVASVNLPSENEWAISKPFVLECSRISELRLLESPPGIAITSDDVERKFVIKDSGVDVLCPFVQELIVHGVAVPCDGDEYSFECYKRGHRGFYVQMPMWIRLDSQACQSLKGLWNEALRVMGLVLKELDSMRAIPKDPAFPLGAAALLVNRAEMAKAEMFMKNVTEMKMVMVREWVKGELLDQKGKGRVKQWNTVRKRLSRAGCESCVVRKVIPYILGMGIIVEKDETESKHERHKRWKDRGAEFQKIVKAIGTAQESEVKSVLKRDVRKDAFPFKVEGSSALQMVETVVAVWVHEHANVGYVRELVDLLVPFFLVFLPKWSDDGCPLDKKGKPMSPEKKDKVVAKIYCCFEAFLKLAQVETLWTNADKQVTLLFDQVDQVVSTISPAAAAWLRARGLNNFSWCLDEIKSLFVNTFSDVWSVWVRWLCCPIDLRRWFIYLISAIVMDLFDKMVGKVSCLEEAASAFRELSKELDIDKLSHLIMWTTRNHHF